MSDAVSDAGDARGEFTVSRRGLWIVHGVLTACTVALLVSDSFPGSIFWVDSAALPILLMSALGWLVWTPGSWRPFRRRFPELREPSDWWYAVAPVGAAVYLSLAALHVPLHARWAFDRPDFAAVVQGLPDPATGRQPVDGNWPLVAVPDRIGSYWITEGDRVSGGYLFYEYHGVFFDDAGFAYLPKGPTPDLNTGSFESPSFVHLGGPWYSWTASW